MQPTGTGQLITDVQCPRSRRIAGVPHPRLLQPLSSAPTPPPSRSIATASSSFDTALAGAADNHCSYNWQTNCQARKNDQPPSQPQVVSTSLGITQVAGALPRTPSARMEFQEVYIARWAWRTTTTASTTCNWPDLLVESPSRGATPLVASGTQVPE